MSFKSQFWVPKIATFRNSRAILSIKSKKKKLKMDSAKSLTSLLTSKALITINRAVKHQAWSTWLHKRQVLLHWNTIVFSRHSVNKLTQISHCRSSINLRDPCVTRHRSSLRGLSLLSKKLHFKWQLLESVSKQNQSSCRVTYNTLLDSVSMQF